MTYHTRGSTWDLPEAQVMLWQAVYPALDVRLECERARIWLEANSRKRKTSRGMPRFLVAWLNRTATDNRAQVTPRKAAQMPTYTEWTCPHVEEHANRWRCEQATALNRPRKAEA